MIYELIRRDPAWRGTRWLAMVSAVVWACPSPIGQLGVFVAIMGLFGGQPQRRATRFEAGLPIEARDLLLARTLSLMALIWIAALSGVAGIVVVKGLSAQAAKPLEMGALCTLMAGMVQAAWRKQLAGPTWTLLPIVMVLPAAGPLMVDHTLPVVPPLCALVGVGLFVWNWVAAPRSFQLSETGPRADGWAGQSRKASARAAFPWAPVWRSVCSWQYVLFVPMMGLQTATGQWLLTPWWMLMVWLSLRVKTRWLWALPVGRRALLWTMIGPILAVHILGYFASFRVHRYAAPVSEPRVVVLSLAAILGLVMLTILFLVLVDWRGFARFSRVMLMSVFFSLFGIWYLATMGVLVAAPHGATWAQEGLAQISGKLPMSLPALIASAAAVLIALYWAVEKVFSEPDFADKPRVNQPDAFA
jgi:hypothetical protein